MLARKIFNFMLICFGIAALASCSESEDQRDFREQALSGPSGIMAMTVNGTPVEDGENDADDWRTAPAFTGLTGVEVTPVFPNPVSFNSSFELQVNIKGSGFVNGLQIFAFQDPNDPTLLRTESQTQNARLCTFRISPQEFASSAGTGNLGNLYRIVIYDGRGDIISYGDVQIE